VFCDLSTPRTDGTWNAYDELRRRLIAHGIPAGEIAFIHDANNDEARAKLFARCRSGQIAVLIGSTQKMGVGTNIHTRAVALHHLDCPWRPADIEQREGRIIRQRNQNAEVEVVRHATEGSFDVFMWQTCERKAGFIDQVMRGQLAGRELDDVGDNALSYAEVKALATGNPLVIEQAGVQADIAKLERLAAAHRTNQARLRGIATQARTEATHYRRLEAQFTGALGRRVDTSGDRFHMEIAAAGYTSRVDAGKVLLGKARDLIHEIAQRHGRAETRVHTIGRLGGFPVTACALKLNDALEARLAVELGDTAHLELRLTPADIQAKRPDGVITSLEGGIRRLDDKRAEAERRAVEAERRAATADNRLGTGFPDQTRLDRLRRRYQEILDESSPADADTSRATQLERPRAGALPSPGPPGLD
jgi:Helicase conserved C-terminal domain